MTNIHTHKGKTNYLTASVFIPFFSIFQASASCDGSVVVWNIEEQVCRCCVSPLIHFHDDGDDDDELLVSLQTQVISWPLLQKTNDITNATSLCRLAWQPATGQVCVTHPVKLLTPGSTPPPVTSAYYCPCAQFLAVPVGTCVHLYERDSWNHVSSLSDDLLNQVSAGLAKMWMIFFLTLY